MRDNTDTSVEIYYTTAPTDYDYKASVIATRPTRFADHRGRPYREVMIHARLAPSQGERYLSGLYPVKTVQEMRREIELGLVKGDHEGA